MRAVGDKIGGRYEIVSVAGQRPLGVLYRAIDLEIGVDVALRVIAPGLLPEAGLRQAFVTRLQRGKALSHANIVRLYDVALDGDEVVVAVQWAPGQMLSERLAEGPLALAEVRAVLKQAAAGIGHAHQHGVVLGDLRAETVVVLESAVKLSNVGVGPALPRKHYLEAMRETPAYARLAPEIRSGGPAEPRADVYALALLVVEMMTGKLPSTPLAIKDAPAALVTVLQRSLSEDPLLRHASAEALHHELDAIFSGGVLVQRTPGARDSTELTPLLPTLPPAPTPSDSNEVNTAQMPRLDEEETRPGDSLEATRQVSEQELDRLRGAEVTRLVSEEEIFPLRVRSSETQQVELDMIVAPETPSDEEELELEVVREADGTMRSPIPKPPNGEAEVEELKTSEVILLEPDAAHTIRVPRAEEEIPPPPRPISVESAPPIHLAHAAAADPDGTPLPPPAPAPPSLPGVAEDFGDESTKTTQLPRLPPEPDAAPARSNDLKPRARELVVTDRPDTPNPAMLLPKIEVQLPVEARAPTPPRGSPSLAVPSLGPPPRVPRRTQEMPALPSPQRTTSRWVVVLLIGFFTITTAIVIAVVSHMQALKLQRNRVEKQRLADDLRARADAMRHAPGPDGRSAPPRPVAATAPKPGAPTVTSAGPCPLGSNLIDSGKPFCVDVYEYPGGRTIPRTNVSYEEADKLCQSRGERLCTESEWEKACRGKGGTSFPYGSAFDPDRCNIRSAQIAPAGDYKECRSGSGAYDMSGNVAEWVTAKGQPAQKGGFTGAPAAAHASRCSNTTHVASGEGGVLVGFRCCADPKR